MSSKRYNGEIIMPFFLEGGRFTMDDIHYVQDGTQLIPAGETEFAKDKTFGFSYSNLRDWCEEKSGGTFASEEVTSISLQTLRAGDVNGITSQLMNVKNFGKIIVNAID